MIGKTVISFFRDRAGAALVEFSLLLSFLLLGMVGIVEVSRAIYQFNVANKGVAAAARYVARLPGHSCDDEPGMESALKAAAIPVAMRANLQDDNTVAFSLSNWDDNSPGTTQLTLEVECVPNTGANALRGPDAIPVIKVAANFPFNSLGALELIGLSGFNITAEHEEVYIGE